MATKTKAAPKAKAKAAPEDETDYSQRASKTEGWPTVVCFVPENGDLELWTVDADGKAIGAPSYIPGTESSKWHTVVTKRPV